VKEDSDTHIKKINGSRSNEASCEYGIQFAFFHSMITEVSDEGQSKIKLDPTGGPGWIILTFRFSV